MKPYHCEHCGQAICEMDMSEQAVQSGSLRFQLPRNGFTIVCVLCGTAQRIYPVPTTQRIEIRSIPVAHHLKTH